MTETYTQDDLDRAAQEARAVALEEALSKSNYFADPKLVFQAKRRDGTEKRRFSPEEVMAEIRAVSKAIGKDILALLDTPAAEALERVRAEEREACARVAEGHKPMPTMMSGTAHDIAAAIRALGATPLKERQ